MRLRKKQNGKVLGHQVSEGKPWNRVMEVEFDERHRDVFRKWYAELLASRDYPTAKLIITKKLDKSCLRYITNMYKEGYGLKIIARELGISYTKVRVIFAKLGIEIRRGRSIVTDKVRKFRSERVTGTNNPWSDWECRQNVNTYGVAGYYVDRKRRKIWLRSSWEYIYAKWLDSKKIHWDYECRQYLLSNGETYRPDFTIHDKSSIRIVEIKGYIKDNLYKADMLRDEYNLDVTVIEDISQFCKNYNEELAIWKCIQEQKK